MTADKEGRHHHHHYPHGSSPSPSSSSSSSNTTPTTPQKTAKIASASKSRGSIRKPYVKRACTNCKKSHAACDDARPCKRCVQLGIEDKCVDAERKKPTKRPRKKEKQIFNVNGIGGSSNMNGGNTNTFMIDEDDYDDDEEDGEHLILANGTTTNGANHNLLMMNHNNAHNNNNNLIAPMRYMNNASNSSNNNNSKFKMSSSSNLLGHNNPHYHHHTSMATDPAMNAFYPWTMNEFYAPVMNAHPGYFSTTTDPNTSASSFALMPYNGATMYGTPQAMPPGFVTAANPTAVMANQHLALPGFHHPSIMYHQQPAPSPAQQQQQQQQHQPQFDELFDDVTTDSMEQQSQQQQQQQLQQQQQQQPQQQQQQQPQSQSQSQFPQAFKFNTPVISLPPPNNTEKQQQPPSPTLNTPDFFYDSDELRQAFPLHTPNETASNMFIDEILSSGNQKTNQRSSGDVKEEPRQNQEEEEDNGTPIVDLVTRNAHSLLQGHTSDDEIPSDLDDYRHSIPRNITRHSTSSGGSREKRTVHTSSGEENTLERRKSTSDQNLNILMNLLNDISSSSNANSNASSSNASGASSQQQIQELLNSIVVDDNDLNNLTALSSIDDGISLSSSNNATASSSSSSSSNSNTGSNNTNIVSLLTDLIHQGNSSSESGVPAKRITNLSNQQLEGLLLRLLKYFMTKENGRDKQIEKLNREVSTLSKIVSEMSNNYEEVFRELQKLRITNRTKP